MGLVRAAFLELATLEELLSTVKWSHNNCDNTTNLPRRMSSLKLKVVPVDPPVDRGVRGHGDVRCGNVGNGSWSWTYFLRSCQDSEELLVELESDSQLELLYDDDDGAAGDLQVARGAMAILSLRIGLVGMFASTPASRTVPLIPGVMRGFAMVLRASRFRMHGSVARWSLAMSCGWGELITGRTREWVPSWRQSWEVERCLARSGDETWRRFTITQLCCHH